MWCITHEVREASCNKASNWSKPSQGAAHVKAQCSATNSLQKDPARQHGLTTFVGTHGTLKDCVQDGP